MNEARNRNRQVQITVLNPSLTDPLQGLSFEQLLARPRNLVIMANDYKAPVQDQVSIGFAQELGGRYAIQADVVHQVGRNIQMSRSINFFENPTRACRSTRLSPAVRSRSSSTSRATSRPAARSTTACSSASPARRGPNGHFDFQGGYTLSWTKGSTDANRFGAVNNPFDVEDEYLGYDRRSASSSVAERHDLPAWDINLSTIVFVGSPRPINISTNLDPFGTGAGRWLDASGGVLPKNGERALYWDKKVDLRLVKNVKSGRPRNHSGHARRVQRLQYAPTTTRPRTGRCSARRRI